MATLPAEKLMEENENNGTYTGENIKVLEGMEAVRLRPAMYIGSTGEMGLHHFVYEVVDNSVDEALAGFANKIDVIIHVDNSITVIDDGRGIPTDMKTLASGEEMSAVQVVLTKLNAGGKFDSSSYKVSGGLHGVGVSCVNALSQELERRDLARRPYLGDGFQLRRAYQRVAQIGHQQKARHQGAFPSRQDHLHSTEFNYDTLAQRLRELAFLNKGLEITLTDERTADAKTGEPRHADLSMPAASPSSSST